MQQHKMDRPTDGSESAGAGVIGADVRRLSGHNVTARFGTKRGGSGMRSIRTAEDAEKILAGGYGVTTVTLECSCSPGEAIGRRWLVDRGACDDRRVKWAWSFDQDHFDPYALAGTYAFAAKLRAGGKKARAALKAGGTP